MSNKKYWQNFGDLTESERFKQDSQNEFQEELLPLAELDTTGISLYFKALAIRGQLNYARNEVARGIVNGTMTEPQALEWLTKYGLYSKESAQKSIAFIKGYRSYVINYNYGMDLVKHSIEVTGGAKDDISKRWELFGKMLSSQVLPQDLSDKTRLK